MYGLDLTNKQTRLYVLSFYLVKVPEKCDGCAELNLQPVAQVHFDIVAAPLYSPFDAILILLADA